jgi:hypothetical protein
LAGPLSSLKTFKTNISLVKSQEEFTVRLSMFKEIKICIYLFIYLFQQRFRTLLKAYIKITGLPKRITDTVVWRPLSAYFDLQYLSYAFRLQKKMQPVSFTRMGQWAMQNNNIKRAATT